MSQILFYRIKVRRKKNRQGINACHLKTQGASEATPNTGETSRRTSSTQACTSGSGQTECVPDLVSQADKPGVIAYLVLYLQKGDDKRSQREVGGFLELGVKFFDG